MSKISANTLRDKDGAIEVPMKYPVRGSAKAWLHATYSGGTPVAQKSLNVASLTDVAEGVAGVNLTSAMADTVFNVVTGTVGNTYSVLWSTGELLPNRTTAAFRLFEGFLNGTTWTMADYTHSSLLNGDLA